jgi:hypothetical protein
MAAEQLPGWLPAIHDLSSFTSSRTVSGVGAHAYTDLDVIQEWAPNPSRGHWPGDEPSYNGFDGPHRGVCG